VKDKTEFKEKINKLMWEWYDILKAFSEFEDINSDVIEQIIIIGKYGGIRRLIIKKKEDETLTFRYIG